MLKLRVILKTLFKIFLIYINLIQNKRFFGIKPVYVMYRQI